jgi:Ca2+/Na+ antiporter
MDIRVRAALYSIGFFVGIFALLMILNAITPYLQPWMGSVFLILVLVYAVYQLMLAKLAFDEDNDRLNNVLKKNRDKE